MSAEPPSCFEHLAKLSAFIECANSGSSFPADSDLDAYPRFRPRFFYLRTIHMHDRQAPRCCLQACRKFPVNLSPFLFMQQRCSGSLFRAENMQKPHFFGSVSGHGGLKRVRLVLQRHRSTVHGRVILELQHENPQESHVRYHEQGISEPRPGSKIETHPSSGAAEATSSGRELCGHDLKVGSQRSGKKTKNSSNYKSECVLGGARMHLEQSG